MNYNYVDIYIIWRIVLKYCNLERLRNIFLDVMLYLVEKLIFFGMFVICIKLNNICSEMIGFGIFDFMGI